MKIDNNILVEEYLLFILFICLCCAEFWVYDVAIHLFQNIEFLCSCCVPCVSPLFDCFLTFFVLMVADFLFVVHLFKLLSYDLNAHILRTYRSTSCGLCWLRC